MPDAEVDKKSEEVSLTSQREEKTSAKAEESPNSQNLKQRTVSFNRDVHVKRIAPNRAAAGAPAGDGVRRQPLVGLTRQEIAKEAAKVLAQASAVRCSTASSAPDKFFSLPTRRKHKPDPQISNPPVRRRSEELGITTDLPSKNLRSSLNRSTSDVTKKNRKNSNTIFNLFKRPDKESTQDQIANPKKETSPVKRSKSDVSDLKSNGNRPIRKRTGSESEEYLNSVIGKKTQLSPIIEINQSDDYFKSNNAKVLDISGNSKVEKVVLEIPQSNKNSQTQPPEYKVNPIEKPPRTKEPRPPARPKRARTLTNKDDRLKPVKSTAKHFDTLPKIRGGIKKRLLVDEIDNSKGTKEVKKSIKETILSIEKQSKEEKLPEMIHSSQQPPEKLPLTKGQTVDTMVKILNQDKFSPPTKANLVIPPSAAAHNNNQPFSYTKPTSVSPDPNLYARSLSPDRPPSPINRIGQDRGVIYAQVVCGENGKGGPKQTVHASVTPERRRNAHNSDEDEGLGYEENRSNSMPIYHNQRDFSYDDRKTDDYAYRYSEDVNVTDSPITPRFKEYRSHKFIGDELTFDNAYASDGNNRDCYGEDAAGLRGRGDGMDARRRESLAEADEKRFERKRAELSHRRELLENRFNARRNRDQTSPGDQNDRFSPEKDYDDDDKVAETRKYVSESSTSYMKDDHIISGFTDKYVSDTKRNKEEVIKSEFRTRSKYNPNTSMFEPVEAKEIDRREFIDRRLAEEPLETKYFSQKPARYFPPEPDYEPPSLDSQVSGPKYSPDVRKYKPKTIRNHTSSQEGFHTTSRYNTKYKQEKFGSNRDHYASNPEIAQKRVDAFSELRDEYDPNRPETFHNSLRRQKHNHSDRHYRNREDYLEQSSSRSLRQQDSDTRYGGETSGPESSKSRYENDRDRDNKFADSGIENDYRKDSNGDIHSRRVVSPSSNGLQSRDVRGDPRNESEDEGFASSLLIASERQHTEDNCSPARSNVDHKRSSARRDDFVHRERSIDDGSFYDPRIDKFEERTSLHRIDAKPPKVTKKISGLEKMKQLFSRDSSKKSKKDKDKKVEENSPRSKVRDDDFMVKEEELRRRYPDHRASSDELDNGFREGRRGRVSRTSDVESDSRVGIGRYSRSSKSRDDIDSLPLDYDYSQRRRMATPTPSPSPPRKPSRDIEKTATRQEHIRKPPASSSNGWFKSLDRLSRNRNKNAKAEKDSILTTTEEESTFTSKRYTPNTKPPSKSLRFFGDTDLESNDSISKHQSTLRKRTNIPDMRNGQSKTLNRNTKTLSNSVHGLDRTNYNESKYKSSSLTNLQNGLDSRQNLLVNSYNKEKYSSNKRDLHNISEIHSNSETESQFEEKEKHYRNNGRDYDDDSTLKGDRKPPMSPMRDKRRSRSHSAPKITKSARNGYHGSRGDLVDDPRTNSLDVHTSKNDLRGSRQELSGSRNELRSRRRRIPAGASPADSSTEGDSSHQSQRSIVYLHAATVGDIPTSGRISRGKSRDDVSSVNSSLQPQTKTVSRSFSVLAPWKPRHYREGYDINYSQSGHHSTMRRSEKPAAKPAVPKKESGFSFGKNKSASTRNLNTPKYDGRNSEERLTQNKSGTSTLSRRMNRDDKKISSSNGTLFRKTDRTKAGNNSSKENLNSHQLGTLSRSRNELRDKNYKKSMSTEVLSRESPPKGTKRSSVERERISRSISMPKDPNKSAGWFKITKKSKKVENSSRMY